MLVRIKHLYSFKMLSRALRELALNRRNGGEKRREKLSRPRCFL